MRHFIIPTCLLLSACVQGPDYKRPVFAGLISKAFKHGSVSSSTPPAVLPDEWWKLYRRRQLNALVEEAIRGNADLKAAEARVKMARAVVGGQRAEWFPKLNSTSSFGTQRFSASAFGANLPSEFGDLSSLLERDYYRSSLDLSYEIDLWGKVRRNVEAAKAGEQSAEDTLTAHRLSLAAEVCRHYFLWQALNDQTGILQQTLGLRHEAVSLQATRLKKGLGPESDLARARTEHDLAEADLESVKRQRGSAANALAVLCGKSPASFSIQSDTIHAEPPPVSAGIPSTLLQSRPDVRSAEQQLRAANAEIGVAKAEFFPAFSLVGSGGLDAVKAQDFLKWQNRVLSIGPSVTLPVFQGGRLRAGLSAAYAREEEARAAYKQTIIEALREVEDALMDMKSYASWHRALLSAHRNAVAAADLARLRHQKGLASYFEVVDAERSALSTQLLVSQAQGQHINASVQLAKALGGGWTDSKRPTTNVSQHQSTNSNH
jgi:multidrug efflux system outer membrane protein